MQASLPKHNSAPDSLKHFPVKTLHATSLTLSMPQNSEIMHCGMLVINRLLSDFAYHHGILIYIVYTCILIKVYFFRDLPGQIRKGSCLDGFRNSSVQMFLISPQMNVYSYLSVSYERWLSHFPG